MGWENVGNSFIAARDYAEQERAAGRQPTGHELGMIGLAGRNNPLLGYQRAKVRSAAQLDALNISEKQLEQEMMSRKMEGMARLSALVARSFDDPDTMEREVLKIAYDHNIGMGEIDPILKGIEQKRQYKRRMDALGSGMIPRSMSISSTGGQTMTFVNPDAAAGTTSAMSNLARYTELVKEVDEANASGDPLRIKMAADRMDFFKKQTMSDAEQGISRPLGQGEILRAVIGLTKPTALEELTGAERRTLDDAISMLEPLIERLRSVSGQPAARGQQVPPPVDPDDPLDLGLWD